MQPRHVGILGQWTSVYVSQASGNEVAVIIEDDVDVSRYETETLSRFKCTNICS